MASRVPIGTVIPFAGNYQPNQRRQGWLLCDGTLYDPKDSTYTPLYEVIGTTYGGSGNTSFAVPDSRGLFIRGVDDGAGVDVGAEKRHLAATAALGNGLGSVQGYSTKLPTNPFTPSIPHLPNDWHHGNYGSLIGDHYASWNSGSVTISATGGDAETRPINIYLYFLIKFADVAKYPEIPVGALAPMAGPKAPDGFLLCDGRQLDYNKVDYGDLADAIGTNNGGNLNPWFNVPDCRGRFLRAVSGNSTRDPDRNQRSAPQKDNQGQPSGTSGNGVGSVQGYATATPVEKDFSASIPNLPNDNTRIDHVAGYDSSMDNGGSASGNLADGGGDKESRPVNVYVDWYIRYE